MCMRVFESCLTGVCCLQIGIEDFRVMTESFGMQLDDDSLLALFSRVSHPLCC